MRQLGGDVRGGLTSDLFGETNAWASQFGGTSPGGVVGTLRGDIRNARAMGAAIRELKKKGLRGAALAAVLSQGGLEGAQAFSELSRSEIHEYAELFNRRNRLLRNVGAQAGGAAYGAMLRESRQEYRELKEEVVRLRHAVERADKGNRDEHRKDRDHQRRGAGNGRRNRRQD
jgi:hypothetical protein